MYPIVHGSANRVKIETAPGQMPSVLCYDGSMSNLFRVAYFLNGRIIHVRYVSLL
jgi:hypothetical protein